MSILSWIEDKKRNKVLAAPKRMGKVDAAQDSSKGLWTRCDKCGVILYIKHLKENQRVCFGCSYHLQMMSQERIENLLDKIPADWNGVVPPWSKRGGVLSTPSEKASYARTKPHLASKAKKQGTGTASISTWRPLDETVSPCDPLKFHDQKAYTNRLQDAQEKTGLQDAIQTGTGMIDGIPIALAVMDFSFMGGSMGSVVGEKITRLIEYATGEGLTLIIISASGGARMQEGVFSLMQMAKISSALQIYQSCANLLYISILTSPTTGGVTASFAMLGDIVFAEPKALIAFAGRRVIEQTLREDLPDDFQTSEYMLHHGLVDLIVPRRFLRQAISETIRLYQNAPFKKQGQIPFGVQNPITFLTEEKIRRQWGRLTAESKHRLQNSPLSESLYVRRSSAARTSPDRIKNLERNTILRGETGSLSANQKPEHFKAKRYREILTSFEIMLNLFMSGNSKKQNGPVYDLNRNKEHLLSDSLFAQKGLITKPSPVEQKEIGGFANKTKALYAQAYKSFTNFATFLQIEDLYERFVRQSYLPLSATKPKTKSNGNGTYVHRANTNKNYVQNRNHVVSSSTNRIVVRTKLGFVKGYKKKACLCLLGKQRVDYASRTLLDKTQLCTVHHVFNNAQRGCLFVRSRAGTFSKGSFLSKQNQFSYKALLGTNRNLVSKGWFCKGQRFVRKRNARFLLLQSRALSWSREARFLPKGRTARTLPVHFWGNSRASLTLPERFPLLGQARTLPELKGGPKLFKQTEKVQAKTNKALKPKALQNQEIFQNKAFFTRDETNILNRAIELAATESVEWRAFYMHQQLSQGFLEDFLQQDLDNLTTPYSRTNRGNRLFYKSICRSRKALDE